MAEQQDDAEVVYRRGGPRSNSEKRNKVFQEYSDSDDDAESTSGNSSDPEDSDIPHDETPSEPDGPGNPVGGPLPVTASVRRDIKKEGYLYKQGGRNRNKGWKLRWLEFDGKRLRYYLKKGCAQSLRIIPIQLMISAEHNTECRPVSRSSSASILSISSPREFQFILKCKNRTFLFGTSNSDNCQLWLNCLMAAIIEKDRMNSGTTTNEEYGGDMANPIIKMVVLCELVTEGHIRFDGKRNPYYVALKGSKLSYYYNLEDYRHNSAISELNMEQAMPKDLDRTKLQLLTAQHTFVLQFENSVEKDKWMVELRKSHERCIRGDNMAILESARQTEGNDECADCGSKEVTEWASINLGIVICEKCAGAHRSLGVDVSKIQSLMMDSIFERNEHVLKLLQVIGNRNANDFWLRTALHEARMINQDSFMQIRIKHIKEKYVEKKFIDDQYKGRNQDALNDAFVAAIRDGDILKTMALLNSGAEIFYKSPEDNGENALEIAQASGNLLLHEYLSQNKTKVITNGHSAPASEEPATSTFVGGDQKSTSIYLTGYMEKTNEHMTGYKKRWFVLHYGSITYFADRNNQKGTFDLKHALSISLAECEGRKFCFDLSHRANRERTYRFSAPDDESRKNWFNTILQVIEPQTFVCADTIQAAGRFYVKQHNDNWKHVWLIVTDNCLHMYDMITAEETYRIDLELGVEFYKSGKGCKFVDPQRMDFKVLDGNQSVAIQSGDKLSLVQGMILQDTKKVYSLVEKALCKCYGIR